MSDLVVAAIQMDARVGDVEANLAHAAALVEQAAAQGAQLAVLPELFGCGYEYTNRNFGLAEPLDGPTGTWICHTAQRLGIHLAGSFPARMAGGNYIVAMLAAPDGRQWVYRKMHVALWENGYFDRGAGPVIADTTLGRIGLLICWDQVFADLAAAYQGRVDLLCIPSSPPVMVGELKDEEGRVLVRMKDRIAGVRMDAMGWFQQATVLQAQSANAPVVYAARCGPFRSPIPYGLLFLMSLGPGTMVRVLRAAGTKFRLSCPMMGRSCVVDRDGTRLAQAGQDEEAVLLAAVRAGAPHPAALPPLPKRKALVPGVPAPILWLDGLAILVGRWHRRRHKHG
ncbi:MAG: carbon-nitrogen hydrolase family protein [Anaerolineae bacterium]|nr:carbon-nitrogen hydrolase family protein [Anaerolineae bacterium]